MMRSLLRRGRARRAATRSALIVAVGSLLPVSGFAGPLGFVPLTGTFYLFVPAVTLFYLLSVQIAKGLLWRHAESTAERS